jgi:CRISPR-associated protein Csd1
MTLIFWADFNDADNEIDAGKAESLFANAIDSNYSAKVAKRNELNSSPADLGNLPGDQPFGMFSSDVVTEMRFCVLGLSPNVARLSVRLWLEQRVGVFVDRIAQHYEHLALEPCPWGGKLPSLQRLLDHATVAVESIESISPMLAVELTRAVLNGDRYPLALLYAAITRLRAGDDPARGWHASVIKAVINRSGNAPLPVALDVQHNSVPYQIGRLLAVAEKTQREAFGYHIKSTIANRYYPLASVMPSRALRLMLPKLQVHKLIAQRENRAEWVDKRVSDIEKYLPPILPDVLNLEDQGRVAVGYYHERTARIYTD